MGQSLTGGSTPVASKRTVTPDSPGTQRTTTPDSPGGNSLRSERRASSVCSVDRRISSHRDDQRRSKQELDADLDCFDRSTFAQVKRGKLTDSYEVLDELGTGSFGVVNKGMDMRSQSSCAIKTIPKKNIKDPQKIKDEFNVIRKLDHPHICKAYECYEDRKNIYLVMELLVGGTLLETLCRQTKFMEADAAGIMRQILSALAYLHQESFIFRDLKSENVMFRAAPVAENDCKEIKLIDFGLCCPFEKGSKMCRAAGTPYSVAPELVTAPVQYDQKCDAWSAGVVMYIMLSGKYPFNGKTKDELLHKIRREPCSFSHPVWKKISKDGKTLLAELLRKKADQRTSVSEALLHPWLARRRSEYPSENIMADVVKSFKHFQGLNMFQKAAVTALAWRAGDDETAQLRAIFSALDRDGNGHITIEELRSAIETTGVVIPEDLAMLAMDADTDGGGMIEYTEFLAACLDKRSIIREEVVWEAFRVFDSDGSGKITHKELLKILTGNSGQKIRETYGSKAVNNFLGEYDVSGDSQIDFDEFMEMLQAVKVTYVEEKAKADRTLSLALWEAGCGPVQDSPPLQPVDKKLSSERKSRHLSMLPPAADDAGGRCGKELQEQTSGGGEAKRSPPAPSNLLERFCFCSSIGRASPEHREALAVKEVTASLHRRKLPTRRHNSGPLKGKGTVPYG